MLNNLIKQCSEQPEALSELFTFIWADYAARDDLNILKVLSEQVQTELNTKGINVQININDAKLVKVQLTRYAIKVFFNIVITFSNEGEAMPIVAEFHFNRHKFQQHSKIAFASANGRSSRMRYLVTRYQVHELFNQHFKNLLRGNK